jgi:hypothetical protein
LRCCKQPYANVGRASPSVHMQSPTTENVSHSSSPQTFPLGPTPKVSREREAGRLQDVPVMSSRPQMRLQTDSSDTIRPISKLIRSPVSAWKCTHCHVPLVIIMTNTTTTGEPVRRSNSEPDAGPPIPVLDVQPDDVKQPGSAHSSLPDIRIEDISS